MLSASDWSTRPVQMKPNLLSKNTNPSGKDARSVRVKHNTGRNQQECRFRLAQESRTTAQPMGDAQAMEAWSRLVASSRLDRKCVE